MTAATDAKALQLFLAAIPVDEIKTQLSYRSTTSAMAAISRALKAAHNGKDPGTARQVEVERLDAIYQQIYPLALQGDLKAVDQCVRIGEQRLRLMDAPTKARHGLVKAYEETVQALDLADEDKAVVQTGRMVAGQIDYAVTHGAGIEVTKALYLVPHLMNVLQALGATPEARRQMQEYAGEATARRDDHVDELAAFRAKRFA